MLSSLSTSLDSSSPHPSEESEEAKLEKNRERNRQHAKKTRERKKEMLDYMKQRVVRLQTECETLEQKLEEKNTANILLHLSQTPNSTSSSSNSSTSSGSGKSQSLSPRSDIDHASEPFLLKGDIIDSIKQSVRSKSHSNPAKDSKKRDYTTLMVKVQIESALDMHDGSDIEIKDSTCEHSLEDISEDAEPISRRERNRIHAKMTRDRRKLFTSKMQETIDLLEDHAKYLKQQLSEDSKS